MKDILCLNGNDSCFLTTAGQTRVLFFALQTFKVFVSYEQVF